MGSPDPSSTRDELRRVRNQLDALAAQRMSSSWGDREEEEYDRLTRREHQLLLLLASSEHDTG